MRDLDILMMMMSKKGGPSTRWVWTLNGLSYGVIPAAYLGTSFTAKVDFDLSGVPSASKRTLLSGSSRDVDNIVIDVTVTEIRAFCYIGSTLTGLIRHSATLKGSHTVELNVLNNYAELYLDGSLVGSSTWALDGNQCITYVGNRAGVEGYFLGGLYNIKVTGITNTDVYPSGTFNYKLDEPYSDSHIAVDSDNPDGDELVATAMQKFNDLPEDYTEESV